MSLLFLNGCATQPKPRKHVHHTHKKTRVTAVGDDAAIKAIIKALRE